MHSTNPLPFVVFGLVTIVALLGLGVTTGCIYKTNVYVDKTVDGSKDTASSDTDEPADTDTTAHDTATDSESDTGDSVETGDSGTDEPICEFEVETTTGTVTMSNELWVALSESNPNNGTSDPTVIQVLDLDFGIVHEECPALVLDTVMVVAWYTDLAGSGWEPTNYQVTNMTDGGYSIPAAAVGPFDSVSTEAVFTDLDASIDAAGITLAFAADMSGASAEEDDVVRVDLKPNGVKVVYNNATYTLIVDRLSGSTVVF